MNKNQDSLRKQIIDSMVKWNDKDSPYGKGDGLSPHQERLFDEAIMPVLDAAMKAGELLLHRATTPQKPVAEAIIEWLELCGGIVADVKRQEATASKRELLNVLYALWENAQVALRDAKTIL